MVEFIYLYRNSAQALDAVTQTGTEARGFRYAGADWRSARRLAGRRRHHARPASAIRPAERFPDAAHLVDALSALSA